MKIGITERGDAALDFSWVKACRENKCDAYILITKNISPAFQSQVLAHLDSPILLHATCTGWGGTLMEPNVPPYRAQLEAAQRLIQRGFPRENIIIRVDPIIPTEEGLRRAAKVLDALPQYGLENNRIRISILDGYPHALQRMRLRGFDTGELRFKPSESQKKAVRDMLYDRACGCRYETCAEPGLLDTNCEIGCVSERDLEALGLANDAKDLAINPQRRNGCRCLSAKTELLSRPHPCVHNCAYCYWKD